jgi:hypothetical protein
MQTKISESKLNTNGLNVRKLKLMYYNFIWIGNIEIS